MSTTTWPVAPAAHGDISSRNTFYSKALLYLAQASNLSFFIQLIFPGLMPFDGSEGNEISLPKATEMTKAYRIANPGKTLSVFIGSDILRKLLEQPESQGIRFHYALDGETIRLVAVSADKNENDLIGAGYLIADDGKCSPPHSGQANVLNS